MPLLEWLDRCALPEEARLADTSYAAEIARAFVGALANAGTTTALVFGSHYLDATECLFNEADRLGLRITGGLVVSDRELPGELLTTPERSYDEGLILAKRWHGVRRLRYAVTPRFSVSCSDALLESCGALLSDVDGAMFTSHLNENDAEIAHVLERFPDRTSYTDTYAQDGLLGPTSVLAHNVHPTGAELELLAATGSSVAHCPTSNLCLGSGLFPLRAHLEAGVRVALGSDVGAGTGLFLPKEALQAYFVQQLLGPAGLSLTPPHLLYLATRAGARALGLGDRVGDLAVGKDFDAVWLRPADGSALAVNLRHARDTSDALARTFALATPADVAGVWLRGAAAVCPEPR